MYNKTLKTPSKLKKLESAILNSQDSKEYLFGVVLATIGENDNVPVELKATAYKAACGEIEKTITLHNDGKFVLNATMIKFAFAILENVMSEAHGVINDEHSQFNKPARQRRGLGARI